MFVYVKTQYSSERENIPFQACSLFYMYTIVMAEKAASIKAAAFKMLISFCK